MALIKETMFVEYQGKQFNQKDLFSKARQEWKDSGNKVKDLKSVNIYFKPEEQTCYYVMNEGSKEELSGSFNA